MIADSSIIRIPDDVVFQVLDGEAVLLNMKTEIYFGLDETGTRIWQLVGRERSFGQLARALLEEYDVDEAKLKKHLGEFIQKLASRGLVEVEDR